MPFTFKASDKPLEPVNRIGCKDSSAKIIARSEPRDNPNKYRVKNGFVGTVVEAYSKHNHLIIRPDDVWIAITTQFSAYVEANSETLRDRFVEHKEKKELVVKSSSTLSTTDYSKLCKLMTEQISSNIRDPSIKDWIIPDFSTTTPTDRVVGAVVLMASMKSYFSYKFTLCCGLPKVTLEGVEEDWVHLQDKAKRLLEFDNSSFKFLETFLDSSSLLGLEKGHMAKWYKMLAPILQHFTDSVRGKPDLDWWSRVCTKIGNGSGPRWLSGWITTFCVFNDKGQWVGDHFSNGESITNPNKDCGYSEEGWPIINCNDIPKGFVQVDLVIDDNGVLYSTELLAGHMSTYVQDSYSIRPHLEWLIRVKAEQIVKKTFSELEKLSRQELLDYSVQQGYSLKNTLSHLTNQMIIQVLKSSDLSQKEEDTVCND
jgi:Domain of unknown function (DUF4419)